MNSADLARVESRIGAIIVLAASVGVVAIAAVIGYMIGGSP